MNYYKEIKLNNGMECIIRNPDRKDAREVLQHMILTSGETENMARYPDEVKLTEEDEKDYLSRIADSADAIMIAAFVEGKLVANAGLNPVATMDRLRHRASFGISIRKRYWGMGIGSLLVEACLEMARKSGYEQVELDVVEDNQRGIALYEKFGFKVYGKHEDAFRYRDGHYKSLYLMSCKL
jgi:RimJ/RimL family protein N-acetyltransferase